MKTHSAAVMTSKANSWLVQLPALHAAQRDMAQHPARFRVAACGRRFGKTRWASVEALSVALRGGRVWWIAPTYRMTEVGWRSLRRLAQQLPGTGFREAERQITLAVGGTITVRSGDTPDMLRGEGLDLAILDEAAFMQSAVWTEAIRPALSDRKGRAVFLSTPNGRNWFWHLYTLGQDPDQPEWKSWQFPTSANPYIDPAEIEAAQRLLPERTFRQEYLADFLDDGGAVFRRLTEACTSSPLDGPRPGYTYVFGQDWARDTDFTAIAILECETRRLVHLERFNGVGWAIQRGRLGALADHWRPIAIWSEANSIGGPNIEALLAEGLPVQPFTTTAQSKGPLIDHLALAFERGELAIYPDPVLMAELQAYTLERLPSGLYRYSAPAGLHDDTVIALALAWHGVQQPRLAIYDLDW